MRHEGRLDFVDWLAGEPGSRVAESRNTDRSGPAHRTLGALAQVSERWAKRKRNSAEWPRRASPLWAKVRDLMRLAQSDGWVHVRTTGSHRHYKQASKPNVVTMTVPGHLDDDVPAGTLKSILKATGLEKQ